MVVKQTHRINYRPLKLENSGYIVNDGCLVQVADTTGLALFQMTGTILDLFKFKVLTDDTLIPTQTVKFDVFQDRK